MTKQAFFDALLAQLAGLPKAEQERVIGYYDELICDGIESGREEAAIIAGFGQVEDIARRIWEDYAAPPPKKRSAGMKVLIGTAWVFGVLIGIPLAIVAVVLYIVGWAVLVSLAACAIAAGAAGAVTCGTAALDLAAVPLNALFQIGGGIFAVGFAVLLGVGTWTLFGCYGRLSRWLAVQIKRAFSRKEAPHA